MTNQLELAEPQTTRRTKAIAAAVAALVIVAFMPIFIRVSETDIGPNATVFNLSWMGTVLLLLWNGLLTLKSRESVNSKPIEPSPYTPLILLLLLGMGLCNTAIGMLWTWSLVFTSVANSELLHSVTPLFAVLGGWFFFGLKFDRTFVIGVGIALAGAVVIGLDEISIDPSKLEGDGLALISAMFWAVSLLIQEKLRTQFSATTLILWCNALSPLFILPIILVTGDEFFPHSWSSWLSAIYIALGVVLNMFLTAYSLKWLSSGLVSTIRLLNPTLTAILAWAIFSETLSPLNLLGLVVIWLGIYLVISAEGGIKLNLF